MEVYHESVADVTAITPKGRLDSATCKDLEERLKQIVQSDSTPLVLDLSSLDYISSAGLRVLLVLAKRSAAANGKLALHGLKPNIQEIFDVSGFSTIFTICDSRESAVAAASA